MSRLKEVRKWKQMLVAGFLIITLMPLGACGNTPQTDMGSEEESRITSGNMGTEQDSKSNAQMEKSNLPTTNNG